MTSKGMVASMPKALYSAVHEDGARPLLPFMVAGALPRLGARDRAAVLLGLIWGLSASELVSLRWAHIRPGAGGGLIIETRNSEVESMAPAEVPWRRLRRGPTPCPIAALRALAKQQCPRARPEPASLVLDCSASTISSVVKRVAELAGGDPANFGACSLRAGWSATVTRERVHQIGGVPATARLSTNAVTTALSSAWATAQSERSLDRPGPLLISQAQSAARVVCGCGCPTCCAWFLSGKPHTPSPHRATDQVS